MRHSVSGFIATILLAITFTATAALALCEPAPKAEPVIVHINGINATLDEAAQNAATLKREARTEQIGNRVMFAWNYNSAAKTLRSSSIVGAADTALQTAASGTDALSSAAVKAVLFWDTSRLSTGAVAALQGFVDRLVALAMQVPTTVSGDYAMIVADINRQTSTSTPLVLVPHSQGNYCANTVYDALTSTGRSVGIVGVATPSSQSAQGSDYLSSDNDEVVKWLPGAPPANYHIEYSALDPLGHSFTKVYLDRTLPGGSQQLPGAARTAVLGKLKQAIERTFDATPDGYALEILWGSATGLSLVMSEASGLYTLSGDATGLGTLNNDATGACYQTTDLVTAGQYMASVVNSSTKPLKATVTATYPGGSHTGEVTIDPAPIAGFAAPLAILSVNSDAIVAYGYPKYSFTPMGW